MNEKLGEMILLFLQIIGFVFLVPGALLVFASRWLVQKYELDKSVKCDFASEISEEDLKEYKYNKAVVNLKMLGMLIALPGIALILIAFR